MSYEYRGPEIISELLLNENTRNKGKIKQKQRIDVKCSSCFNIKNIVYQGHVENRLNHLDREYTCLKCTNSKRIIEYNKSNIGKSLEERIGYDKAQNAKIRLSEKSLLNDSVKSLRKFYGMTWEEKFGKEKSDAMKENHSKNCHFIPKFGKDNPQFGKPAHKLSGNGTKGYYNNIYFRSLLEAAFIRKLINENIIFENGELKKYAIPYIFEGRQRNYFSDFITDKYVYEIKPKSLLNTEQNRVKFEAAKYWCMNNNKEYILMTEYDFPQFTQLEIDTLILEGIIKLL